MCQLVLKRVCVYMRVVPRDYSQDDSTSSDPRIHAELAQLIPAPHRSLCLMPYRPPLVLLPHIRFLVPPEPAAVELAFQCAPRCVCERNRVSCCVGQSRHQIIFASFYTIHIA
jgi:hypothetical protein